MPLRWLLFLALAGGHAGALLVAPPAVAPALAGSVYLPAMALQAVGIPAFGAAASGGWSSLSAAGWVLVLMLWAGVWWGVALGLSLAARRGRRR